MGKSPGGAAAIHANRAKKLKAELDRVKAALVSAGFPVEDADSVAPVVEELAAELKAKRRAVEDAEWEAAGSR